ncbi:protein of unknown function [Moritella yayanosii]|uniref:Uncharacterized protein n=1 Tax=Moritella yayanosii TaxID=69539 RepID=A0A330LUC2_9GAMM|nr:protein of unknown function [Moritella yayanosii]
MQYHYEMFPDIDTHQTRKVARKYKSMIADGMDPKALRFRLQSVRHDSHWILLTKMAMHLSCCLCCLCCLLAFYHAH